MIRKPRVHFVHNYLLQPTNPISVNLIGEGGTGSQMLTALARMHQSLLQLGYPGLFVRVFDPDRVSAANMGRQLFSTSEIGRYKADVLIYRLNRFFGTTWKALPLLYNPENLATIGSEASANVTIGCVDTAKARFGIAKVLRGLSGKRIANRDTPFYWLDFGNGKATGQVILSTVKTIDQPQSKKFCPIANLPFITDEFKALLLEGDMVSGPSCSLAEALTRQELFINSTLAQMGASLLWNLFREGMTATRGMFLNLKDYKSQPLPVCRIREH